MLVEILGTGCARCEKLAAAAREAVDGLADARVVKVDDIAQITARGVLMTPALAVDGVVKSSGRVLSAAQIRALIAPVA